MQKGHSNKAMKGKDEALDTPAPENAPTGQSEVPVVLSAGGTKTLIAFHFPTYGRTIKAATLEEAQAILAQQLDE